MRALTLAAASIAAISCSADRSVSPGDPADVLPKNLALLAEASSVDAAGRRIECSVETHITLGARVERSATTVMHYGQGGGDARRYVEREGGSAVAFWAHTYFEDLRIALIGGDSLEIRSPLSETVTDSRFWHEFAVFPGRTRNLDAVTGELASGTWTCWPMDTPPSSGEYHDVDGIAPGTWVLKAANP